MAIKIKIVADYDQRGMTKATRALDDFAKNAQIALGAVAVATAALAVKSVQEFAKFEGAMTQSLAIMGNVSDSMRNEMTAAAREMAKTTTFSAEQAAESYFFLASAGLDAEASVAALPRVASFAQAGMFDMARATDLLTDAQSALGLTIRNDAVKNMENMARVSDVLVKANTLANASVEQFSVALTTKAGASLRALGKDVEEGVAVLAAFADQGIKGEIAGTQLGIVLRDLTTKAIDNKKAFADAGVAVFDSSGEMRNLGDIVADLEVALAGMSDETQKATLLQLGFSDKSLASLQALLGTSEAIKLYEKELRSANGVTDEIANKQLESFNSQLALLQSAVTDVFIEIGQQLTPALKDLIERVKDLLPELGTKLVDAIKKVDFAAIVEGFGNFVILIVENLEAIGRVAGVLLGIAAALSVYRVAATLAATATAIFNSTLVLSPFGLVAVAVAGLTAALVLNNGQVEKAIENYRILQSQTDQTKYQTKQLADQYRENAYVADKYGIETDALRDANLKLAGAAGTVSGEMNRFNNIKLDSVRGELTRTTNTAAALGNQIAANNKQLYYAMKGIDIAGAGIFAPPTIESATPSGPSAAQQARERVQSLIKDSQKQLRDAQKQYNETIERANKNYGDSVLRLQDEYGQRLAGIIRQSQDRLRSAYQSAVQVNLQSLFEQDEEKSVTGLVESLRKKLEGSKNLLSNSADLAASGFSQTFIEQIVAAGTETGNELAAAILNSTPEAQAELQNLFAELERTSNSGMDQLAAQIYEKQGLATQALKDLYATTEMELAEALLDQQAQLEQALIDANTAFADSVATIKDRLSESLAEMKGEFGGLEKTVDQFMAKLDALLAKYRELELASQFREPVIKTMPITGGGGGGGAIIETLPITKPTTTTAPVINVNVKTDVTQSPAMVGQVIAKTVSKYTAGGGGIKGIKVVAL